MRVFIGCTEICGLVNVYADALKQKGHFVTTYVESKNRFYPQEKYDIVASFWANYIRGKSTDYAIDETPDLINRIAFSLKIRTPLFDAFIKRKILEEHDLFIFLYAGIYTMRNAEDLKFLKTNGKKIISILVGTDVRYAYAFGDEFDVDVSKWPQRYLSCFSVCNTIIRQVEEYSDVVLSLPDQMGLAIRPYSHFHIPLDMDRYEFRYSDREIPVVVHAPSNPVVKGTDIVLSVLDQLKNEGLKFELNLVQNKPNHELIRLLSDADILIDELYAHGPGVLSFEAMASGCSVATRYYENSPSCFRPPVVSIDKNNVYFKLKKLIEEKQYREELIFSGRKYVEENNTAKKVTDDILNLLNAQELDCDYRPTYFKENFQLPENESIREKDKEYNARMSKQWMRDYEQHRASLQARGLI